MLVSIILGANFSEKTRTNLNWHSCFFDQRLITNNYANEKQSFFFCFFGIVFSTVMSD